MEADVLEVSDLFDGAQVVAITVAEREDGAAGAEDLFPEMGKGGGRGVGVNRDVLRVDVLGGDALGRLGVQGWEI